jgi:peroxiredoxin Q/BCP
MSKVIEVGQKVPAITLPATGEKEISLSDYLGQKIVLYFYPKDDTPGCTIESNDFNKFLPKFKKAGAVVLGVSRDSVKSHEKFCQKYAFDFDLLSDEDEALCNLFGVIKDKNMYGKKVRGIERSTFVIDEKGKLIQEWRKVSVEGHAEEVLEFIKK